MSPDDWAVKLGKEDAQSALDSGDYGYHKMETGLSTLGLIDDYWSTHEENAEVWFGLSAKTALGRSYRKAFRGRIAELNKKPSLDGENDVIKKISDGVRKADGLYNCYDYSLHIPAEIAGMKSITTVWLRKMRFADEDVETIFTFPNVKIANLDENRIKKVSEVHPKLGHLFKEVILELRWPTWQSEKRKRSGTQKNSSGKRFGFLLHEAIPQQRRSRPV